MKRLYPILNYCLLGLVLGTSVALLAIGAYYVNPNDEEFCLCGEVLHDGYMAATAKTLAEHDGRYATNLFHGLNPLAWGWINGYKWMPVLAILASFGSVAFFLSSLFLGTLKKNGALFLSLFVCCVHFALAPTLVQEIYWMASSFVYLYSWLFFLLWTGAYVRYQKTGREVWFAVCVFCLCLGIGFGEVTLPLNTLLLIGITLYALKTKKYIHQTFVLLIVGAACILFFIQSPGVQNGLENQNRLPMRNIGMALSHYLQVGQTVFLHPVFLFSNLFLFAFLQKWPVRVLPTVAFRYKLLFLLLCLSVGGGAMISIYYIPLGSNAEIPQRVFDPVVFFWQLSIMLFLMCIPPIRSTKFSSQTELLQTFALLGLCISLAVTGNNLSLLAADFSQGKLQAYDRQMQERYRLLQISADGGVKKMVQFEPQHTYPASVVFKIDLKPNREVSHWNHCYEKYFSVYEVGLVGDTVHKSTQMPQF